MITPIHISLSVVYMKLKKETKYGVESLINKNDEKRNLMIRTTTHNLKSLNSNSFVEVGE